MDAAYEFIQKYGLWAVALGAFFEGEATLIAAGILAGHQFLKLPDVWLYAFIGGWIGHFFWFYVGRYLKHTRLIGLIPNWKKNVRIVNRVIRKNPWSSVIFLQYAYGLRIAGAIAFGITRIRLIWFMCIQLVNCAIWAAIFTMLGYTVGESINQDFATGVKYIWVAGSIVIILVILAVLSRKKFKNQLKSGSDSTCK